MKKPNILHHVLAATQRLALASGNAALVALAMNSTQAATTTSTFDLTGAGSGTTITSTSPTLWVAKGALPVGSILRAVSVNATLVNTPNGNGDMSYVSELGIIFDPTPVNATDGDNLLVVGDNYDGALPGATKAVAWGVDYAWWAGANMTTSKMAVDGIPAIDLSTVAVLLGEGYNNGQGTIYSGSITLTYDLADPNALKDITAFSFGTLGDATISGTSITKTVPYGTSVTALSPTYTLSGGECLPASGSSHNFSSTQTYTVKAIDNSTKDYTVTVTVADPVLTYDFSNGLQGWTQIYAGGNNGNVWNSGGKYLGNWNSNDDNTYFARSPEFQLIGSGNLTFKLAGGQSSLAAPAMAPSAVPQASANGGFAGVALRNVTTDTYVLSARRSGSGDAWQTGTFTADHLKNFVGDGNMYTLDYIDYTRGDWGWVALDDVSIPGATTLPGTATTTTLASSSSPSSYGDTVTFTATVAPAPTGGMVQFYDNAVALGNPVAVSGGQAQLPLSALSVGGHPITATYSGTTGISGSTASVITQTVNQATATITTAPTATAISYGQTLASSTLSGGVGSVAGSFAFTTPATAPGVGSAAQNVTFTPTNANYTAATTTVSVTVNKATPVYKAPVGAGELINVSIGGATKANPTGPAGGTGATWNQFTWSGQWQPVTGSSLKNSANVTTTVSFDFTNQWNAFDPWGNPSQTLLKNGANPNGSQTGTITGLTPGTKYDIYIASYHGNDRNNGSFSTANSTTNGSTQSLDSTATPNGSTWVDGQNYVGFMGTVADGSGIISLTWNPINYLAIMGFQIVAAGAPTPAATDIAYGQKLSASTLSGTFVDAAGAAVAGVLAFTNPNEVPNVGKASHGVTFTPTDTANYSIGTTMVDVTVTAPTDLFGSWISTHYPGLSDKSAAGDPDGDGMSNKAEYAFGLDPSSGASCNPIKTPLDKTTGTFSYTRRVGTGYTYRVWTSTDLVSPWTEDTTAVQNVDSTAGDVETVTVTLSGFKPLAAQELFMRVSAE